LKGDNFKSAGIKRLQAKNNKQFANLKGGLLLLLTVNEMVLSSGFKSKICKKELV